MPTSEICPRSIIRYRPIATDVMPTILPWSGTGAKRQHTPSARSSHPTFSSILAPIARRLAVPTQGWTAFFSSHSSGPLVVCVGTGMCLALLLLSLGQLLLGWAQTTTDTLRYGYPRTFQTTAFVGQEGSSHLPSHFLATNDHGRIEIIELPGDDPSRARLLLGPQISGPRADLVPVTLRFLPSNRPHYPNMLIQCGPTSQLFVNQDGKFTPATTP
jgi:hypothetical protein